MKNDNEMQKSLGMTKNMRRVSLLVSLLMGISMSFIFSLLGTLLSGHFTIISWAMSFMISLVMSVIIGFVIPMRRITDVVCFKYKLKPNSLKGAMMSALISDLIYTPIITIFMVVFMVGGANRNIDQMIEKDRATLEYMVQQQATLEVPDEKLSASIAQLNGKIEDMQAGKPKIVRELSKSFLACFALGFFVIMILQPIYLKVAMKIHLKGEY